ncbi:MAG: molybdenum cofactor guanylyltransferase MobA [Betaproteobacteria bacterium HGW-Betaproteobacteria-15]|jgi:molybdopterin-guanine dinucleotide biosynthesis protein A|nr:MAG: molybdenum cofactor guanylyltransferase MobA [Betaproteobacteria bacterium HGW-Betaproteobacteria-15]
MSISGVILAGGLARRMGGVDKGLIAFAGKPMIAHVLERLRPQVDEILINANREIDQYEVYGYPVIPDEIEGFAGPLAGLHRGMSAANQPFVLTVPCDSPFLPADLASRLMQALQQADAGLAVAKTGTQAHPVFCLCRTSLKNHLQNYLQGGGRKIDAWYNTLKVVEVAFDDQPQAFANINTIEELESLQDQNR